MLIYAVTGIHPHQMPRHHFHRRVALSDILKNQVRNKVGEELAGLIGEMVEFEPMKRINNYQLRRLLKEKEKEIIRGET